MTRRSRKEKIENRNTLFWLTEAQAALGWGIVLALVALLGTIYLYQASGIAEVGREVQTLQEKLDEVKRLNADLERDVAEAQSLERLQTEMVRLGFVRARPEDIEYLIVPDYPAEISLQATPTSRPADQPVESMGEALWLAVQASIGDLAQGESP